MFIETQAENNNNARRVRAIILTSADDSGQLHTGIKKSALLLKQ